MIDLTKIIKDNKNEKSLCKLLEKKNCIQIRNPKTLRFVKINTFTNEVLDSSNFPSLLFSKALK